MIPPWQDMNTLCRNICVSTTTVENWVAQGILPPSRKRGRKLMWKWSEVDEYLTNGGPSATLDAEASEVFNAARRAATETRPHHRGQLRRPGPAVRIPSNPKWAKYAPLPATCGAWLSPA